MADSEGGSELNAIDDEVAALIRKGPFESMILDTAPADFDSAKLLEELTSAYIADDGAGGVALDPHALKKLFSTVTAMLNSMEHEASDQSAELEEDAELVEDEYRRGLAQNQSTLEVLSANLARVDERFRRVTTDAVRTGDSLNRKEQQRLRAVDAIELLEHFKVFDMLPDGFADDYDSMAIAVRQLPAVFADEERRMEAAHVLSRLRTISFELDAPGLGRAAGNMRAYSDFLEKELLDLFERAAGRHPPEADFMRECAEILYALNEGEHLQGRYVYFVVSKRLSHKDIHDSSMHGEAGQDSLSGLFGRVINVCQTEFPLIIRVFPPLLAPKVTRLLLQRILSDPVYGIQACVEQVLSPPPPLDPLPLSDYLDCLAMVEQQTWALFDLLKAQAEALVEREEEKQGERDMEDKVVKVKAGDNLGEGGDGSWEDKDIAGASIRAQAVVLMKYLDDQAKHMFFEHREKYPAKETRHILTSLLRLADSCWSGAIELRGIKNTVPSSLSNFPQVHLDRVVSFDQLLAGPLRSGALRQVLSLSADAVHRCRSILPDIEEREQKVTFIWTTTCNFLVGHLLLPSLQAAYQLLPNPLSANSSALKDILGDVPPAVPPRQLYEIVAACMLASDALQAHHADVIAHGMESIPTLRTISLETRRSHIQQVEDSVGRVLRKGLELLAAAAERILASKKSKDDYALRDDSMAAMDASKTVKTLCSLLYEEHTAIKTCLPTMDITILWEAVGLSTLMLFGDHLKRSKITVTGAFVLANDVNALQQTLGAFAAPRVDSALEDLREIANLFIVPPNNLGALMETGRLVTMARTELKEFVRQRADFAQGAMKSIWVRDLFGPEDPLNPPFEKEMKLGRYKEKFDAELVDFGTDSVNALKKLNS